MQILRLTAGLVLLGTIGFACKDGTTTPPTPVPTTLSLNNTSATIAALGATATVTVTVLDQNGTAMTGQTVTWTTQNGAVATVSGNTTGTITAVGNGQTTVTATVGSATAQVQVTVEQVTSQLAKISGDNQTGPVGDTLGTDLVVELRDSRGNPVPTGTGGAVANSVVTFAVATGGGSVTQASATVDGAGRATTRWVLGGGPAGAQTVSASTAGGAVATTFTATGSAGAADSVYKVLGDTQSGAAGFELPDSIVVKVVDAYNNPVAGDPVAFAVTSGGGSVSADTVVTAATGNASVAWTLGPAPGGQTMTATAAGLKGSPLTFSATASAPDSMAVVLGDGQSGATNVPLTDSLIVRVFDQFGNPFQGHAVAFAITSGGGSVSDDTVLTDATGQAGVIWTLGGTPGMQEATATAVGVSKGSPFTFTATAAAQVATALVKVDGDNLIGLVAKPTNIPPVVKVEDQLGNPMAGESVTFTVTGGGGTVEGGASAMAVTDANGLATVTDWTLGGSAGANGVQVTSGALTPVDFTATGQTAAFDIVVRFYGDTTQLSAGAKAAFAQAEAFWETLIFGDLVDAGVNTAFGACIADQPAVNETVDDLLILAKIDSIDGPSGILGQAGPCRWRTSGANAPLTTLGVMVFDSADVASFVGSGLFDEIVLHEMGHVLGFGTLWDMSPLALFAGACPVPPNSCMTDPHMTGARAIAAFDRVGGTAYTAGAKVPAEDCLSGVPAGCGGGTVNSHWRERVFATELMTGYIGGGAPLSIVSVGALWDMGYLVNYSDADAFSWPSPTAGLRAANGGIEIDLGPHIYLSPELLEWRRSRAVPRR